MTRLGASLIASAASSVVGGLVAAAVATPVETKEQRKKRLNRERCRRYRRNRKLNKLSETPLDEATLDSVLDDIERLPEPDASVYVIGEEDHSLSPETDA